MKKLLTTLLSAVVTIVIATATLASAQTSSLKGSDTFTDIPEGHWADEAIGWAVENGITTGTSETMFSPDNTLTRAQMITFLYRYHTNVAHEAPSSATPTEQRVDSWIYAEGSNSERDYHYYFVSGSGSDDWGETTTYLGIYDDCGVGFATDQLLHGADNRAGVQYRVTGGTSITQEWWSNEALDSLVTPVPGTTQTTRFLDELRSVGESGNLFVTFTSLYDDDTSTAAFDVTGVDDVLSTLGC